MQIENLYANHFSSDRKIHIFRELLLLLKIRHSFLYVHGTKIITCTLTAVDEWKESKQSGWKNNYQYKFKRQSLWLTSYTQIISALPWYLEVLIIIIFNILIWNQQTYKKVILAAISLHIYIFLNLWKGTGLHVK